MPEHIFDSLTNLQSLNLSVNKITGIPEHIFDRLTNLRFLVLSVNKITEIPGHIFDNLINLEILHLTSNEITAIPEHIFDRLINLKEVSMANNKIIAIQGHIFDHLTKLQVLNLSENKITTIPDIIFNHLIDLHNLHLHHNKIMKIPEHLFDHLTNLITLSISYNNLTRIPEHIFDNLINLTYLYLNDNKITTIPLSILNRRLLRRFIFRHNPIKQIDVRIQRFIDNIYNRETHGFFSDSENVHSLSIQSSVKDSIDNLMRDPFTMDKEDIIKQLIEESPGCLQSLLCYLDDKDIHSTLYLTFFEVFVKVWGRIISSDFKADLIKRLEEEMMDSECKCFTGRMSRLVNVLVGFFSDINITVSNNERIGAIISSVLKGREMTDELKEVCRKSLKEAEIEEDEIGKWLDG
jgi:hypothetical protein